MLPQLAASGLDIASLTVTDAHVQSLLAQPPDESRSPRGARGADLSVLHGIERDYVQVMAQWPQQPDQAVGIGEEVVDSLHQYIGEGDWLAAAHAREVLTGLR